MSVCLMSSVICLYVCTFSVCVCLVFMSVCIMSMYMGVCLSSYYGCVPYESVSDIVCQICVYNLCMCLFMCAHFLYVSVQCISVCINCIACTCVWAYLYLWVCTL